MHIYVYTYMYIYIYAYIYMCVYMYISMYRYTHIFHKVGLDKRKFDTFNLVPMTLHPLGTKDGRWDHRWESDGAVEGRSSSFFLGAVG